MIFPKSKNALPHDEQMKRTPNTSRDLTNLPFNLFIRPSCTQPFGSPFPLFFVHIELQKRTYG